MKRLLLPVLVLSMLSVTALCAAAEPVKVFVTEIRVTGVQEKKDFAATLQTLLASRLSGGEILAVESANDADIIVTGSYVVFGKVFSMDAVANVKGGGTLARGFVQGVSADELIPAVGKLAQILGGEIAKDYKPTSVRPPRQERVPPVHAAGGIAVAPRPAAAPSTDIVRAQPAAPTTTTGWMSQRLTSELIGIAPGKSMPNGTREFYLVGDRSLRLSQQGDGLKTVAEVSFSGGKQILGVDSADLDGDGEPEAYVTIFDGDSLSSEVWTSRDGKLVRVAEKLPYYFRGIALGGREKKIYVQQMGNDTDFYGDVYELVKVGSNYEMKNAIKLPRFGFLYNFSMITDRDGKELFVVLNDDGYLIVYDRKGEELWRSGDKYGGTELFFKRPDLTNVRVTGESFRWIFLQQRIAVTTAGEVVVPQNTGFYVLGNSRSYSKNTIVAFVWTGAALDETWHTKQSQNYLADYYFDEGRKELVMLEVVKKEGIIAKGASVITVKKVE